MDAIRGARAAARRERRGRTRGRPLTDRDILRSYGYDADDPVPRDEDGERVIPDRLLIALGRAPFERAPETPAGQSDLLVEKRGQLEAERQRVTDRIRETLTPRQLEILLLLAEGHPQAEIGRRLFIEVSTIRSHITKIRWKLGGSRTMAQAVAVAFRQGLIH